MTGVQTCALPICGDSEQKGFTYRTLMVAGMHFMDSYNYDVERVKRCVIHYAAPDGRIYPFCAYNSGPVFRDRIEKQFSIPFEQQPALKSLLVKGINGANGSHGVNGKGKVSREEEEPALV